MQVLYNVIVIHNSLLLLIQFHVVNSIAFGHIFCVQPCFRIFSCCCVRHKVQDCFFVIYVIIAFILCFVSISFNSISVVSFVGIVIPVRHEVH